MIELLLQAERALTMGLVDQAERLYRQAFAADPQNSIAVVGLARVALERADDVGALREARRALAIDPENVAASRLAARLEEVLAYRDGARPTPVETVDARAATADEPAEGAAVSARTLAPGDPSPPITHPVSIVPPPLPTRSVLDRLFRRNRP